MCVCDCVTQAVGTVVGLHAGGTAGGTVWGCVVGLRDCGVEMWGAFLGLGHHLGWPRELWVSVTVGVAGGPSEILTRLGKIYFRQIQRASVGSLVFG